MEKLHVHCSSRICQSVKYWLILAQGCFIAHRRSLQVKTRESSSLQVSRSEINKWLEEPRVKAKRNRARQPELCKGRWRRSQEQSRGLESTFHSAACLSLGAGRLAPPQDLPPDTSDRTIQQHQKTIAHCIVNSVSSTATTKIGHFPFSKIIALFMITFPYQRTSL